MGKKISFLEGFLLGSVLTGLFGFLFYTENGKETREKLKAKLKELEESKGFGQDSSENRVAKTLQAIEKGFEKLNTLADQNKRKSGSEDKKAE